jgi:hypothetical protein
MTIAQNVAAVIAGRGDLTNAALLLGAADSILARVSSIVMCDPSKRNS